MPASPSPQPGFPKRAAIVAESESVAREIEAVLVSEGWEIVAAGANDEDHDAALVAVDCTSNTSTDDLAEAIESARAIIVIASNSEAAEQFIRTRIQAELSKSGARFLDWTSLPVDRFALGSRVRMADAFVQLADARRRFVRDIAHDLKNPIAAVRFSAQLMEEMKSDLPPRAAVLADGISRGTADLLETIKSAVERES